MLNLSVINRPLCWAFKHKWLQRTAQSGGYLYSLWECQRCRLTTLDSPADWFGDGRVN